MQLRLTRHAIDDLNLDVETYRRQPANRYTDAHAVVKAFVDLRSQNPNGQEWTNLPKTTRTRVFNLHSGRYRGLTWHDEDADVVWLLGVGWHESGSKDDAYAVLKRRDVDGTLMPDENDYIDLELTVDETLQFVELVADEAPPLRERALASIGSEITGVIAERLGISLLINVYVIQPDNEDIKEFWIGFELPPLDGPCELPPQAEWIAVVLSALLPKGALLEGASYGLPFPRPGGSRANEITVNWSSI